jgi:hypothetical protein
VEHLGRCVLDRAVHPLGLTIRSRVVWLCQLAIRHFYAGRITRAGVEREDVTDLYRNPEPVNFACNEPERDEARNNIDKQTDLPIMIFIADTRSLTRTPFAFAIADPPSWLRIRVDKRRYFN